VLTGRPSTHTTREVQGACQCAGVHQFMEPKLFHDLKKKKIQGVRAGMPRGAGRVPDLKNFFSSRGLVRPNAGARERVYKVGMAEMGGNR
jgi:hypothetical protein